jgi:hypothetical protein
MKPTTSRKGRRRSGRRAQTVSISLWPHHLEWMDGVVRRRSRLGRSAYIQRLVEADLRTGGEVLARAILADYEAVRGGEGLKEVRHDLVPVPERREGGAP